MNVPIAFFLITLGVCAINEAAISTKRRCVDENCTVQISWGKTLTTYAAPEPGILSFRPNEKVKIYSKEAGSNEELWGVEIRNKRGYIPKKFVRENKIIHTKVEQIVDVDPPAPPIVPSSKSERIIIDGTTLYDDIAPSATQDSATIPTQIPEINAEKKVETWDAPENIVGDVGVEETSQETENIKPETFISKESEVTEGTEKQNKAYLDETKKKEDEEDDEVEIDDEDSDDEEDEEEEDEYPEVELKPQNNDVKAADKDNLGINNDNKLDSPPYTKTMDSPLPTQVRDTIVEPGKLPESFTESPPTVAPPTKLPLFFHQPNNVPATVDTGASSENSENIPKENNLSENTNEQVSNSWEKGLKDLPQNINEFVANMDNLSSNIDDIPSSTGESPSSGEEVTPVPIFSEGPPLTDNNPKIETLQEYESVMPVSAEENKGMFSSFISLSSFSETTPEVKEEVTTVPSVDNFDGTPAPSMDGLVEIPVSSSEEVRTPTVEETTPSIIEKVPVAFDDKVTTPSVDETIPSLIESMPSNDETMTSIGENTPSMYETTASVDETAPSMAETAPSAAETMTPEEHLVESKPVENVVESSSSFSDWHSGVDVTSPPTSSEILKESTPEIPTNESNTKYEERTNEINNDPWSYQKLDEMTPKPDVEETTSHDEFIDTSQNIPDTENDKQEETAEDVSVEGGGWYNALSGYFNRPSEEKSEEEQVKILEESANYIEANDDVLLSNYAHNNPDSCTTYGDNANPHCHSSPHYEHYYPPEMMHVDEEPVPGMFEMIPLEISDTLIIVAITGVCVVLFLWGFMIIEKMRKEGPLVGKINNLEQQLLVLAKENEVLSGKLEERSHQPEINENENISRELMEELQRELDEEKQTKVALEEQIQSLEKELENSTELGLEMNKMLTEVLSSQNGSDTLIANIEQLQKQLVEQQSTINSVNDKLNEKDTENHELQLDLEITTKKVVDLQAELEKMMLNHLKAEEEKEAVVSRTENEITELRENLSKMKASSKAEVNQLRKQLAEVQKQASEAQRSFEIKSKEYNLLREGLANSEGSNSVVEQSVLKAEVQQLQQDNKGLQERLGNEQIIGKNFQGEVKVLNEEKVLLKKQYEEADREKLEALTKLDVLSTYFKEKEAELQTQLSKHEAMWSAKQGETTTASERLKFMQEEIQNFKSQVASLQQEIVSQEVDLKSQISVLEKKAHENWMAARQAERRVEDAKQEAAQLRNRLTLRERSLMEDKAARNGMSPLETNGVDHHLNDTASPPLLFGAPRDHLTTSPPLIPGLPPGFPMPPPPGVPPPFLPPPFMPGMPPPPAMFPGDHRPPPLGRMSSPPVSGGGGRYTPDSRAFSPYDRRSPSPTDDDYYDRYDHDYYRPKRNGRRSTYSSGSNSAESLDKMDRHSHSKV